MTLSKHTIDNHLLRKTHFILGSDQQNYISTIKDQNSTIEKKFLTIREKKRK